jgi:rubrerythrin
MRPEAAARCAFCGKPVQGNYREVTGWEKRRTSRQGGLNAVLGRRNTGRHACDVCGYDITHGMEPGTPKLFAP